MIFAPSSRYRAEIASVYGPLLVGGLAIASAAGSIAGEDEDRILALVLAHPVTRPALVAAKGLAVGMGVAIVALGAWVGLIAGVAVAGGGMGVGNLAAGGAAGFAILGYLINGVAPLVDAIAWLRYLSPFYYYAENDPLGNGVDIPDLVVLALFALAMAAIATLGLQRRDLRA